MVFEKDLIQIKLEEIIVFILTLSRDDDPQVVTSELYEYLCWINKNTDYLWESYKPEMEMIAEYWFYLRSRLSEKFPVINYLLICKIYNLFPITWKS